MDAQLSRIIAGIADFERLAVFEANARQRNKFTSDVEEAVAQRAADIGREVVAAKIGRDLASLTPAEDGVIRAAGQYLSIKRRQGTNANRTIKQLLEKGPIGAAEASVIKGRPTPGYETLKSEDLGEASYEQIIVDHQAEFSERAVWHARRRLGLLDEGSGPAPRAVVSGSVASRAKNPDWTRDELVLALDAYMRHRVRPFSKSGPEVAELSIRVRALASLRGMSGNERFRNANGVYMKLGNFHSVDPDYTNTGKTGLPSINGLEREVWHTYALDPEGLAEAVGRLLTEIETAPTKHQFDEPEAPADGGYYWVFVCNPARWAIDRFLASGSVLDTWGVRKSDAKKFAPGQLGLVRVGVDRRSRTELGSSVPLSAGIYALVQVESEAFPGTGAAGDYWSDGEGREPGWPTVNVRYLRVYPHNPLTIDRLRAERPTLSHLVLNGFQGASFPINGTDFETIVGDLEEDLDNLPIPAVVAPDTFNELALLEAKFTRASPEVRERVSKTIERGAIGGLVKRLNGYKCQLCEALGAEPLGFIARSGVPYVEAHHVMPVSSREIGVLSASNIMTLCANHHRLMHYGSIDVAIEEVNFVVRLDGKTWTIKRVSIGSAKEPESAR